MEELYGESRQAAGFRKMYPEASEEIISVLKETERKMQYQEYDLKAEQAVLDRKTGRVSILPGREDSLDRMMEAGLFPDRGEQDIEAEICSRLQYEKLHRAIRQLEKREQYLIIQLFFADAVRGSWQGSFVFHRMP